MPLASLHSRQRAGVRGDDYVAALDGSAGGLRIGVVGEGFAITRIQLACEASVPGIDHAEFRELADGAKQGCPVSKALAGVQIELDAKLVK